MMKINGPKNEHTKTETKCDVKMLKVLGLSDKYQPTSKLRSHDRSFADHRLTIEKPRLELPYTDHSDIYWAGYHYSKYFR